MRRTFMMPSSMDKLPKDKQDNARRVIDRLYELIPEAVITNAQITYFEKRLATTQSMPEFFDIVQQIIETGKEIHTVFLSQLEGLEADIKLAVNECVAEDSDLKNVNEILHSNEILAGSIIATKERLTQKQLFDGLHHEKKTTLENFITSLKNLKPISNKLRLLTTQFQERVKAIKSLEKLDDLEEEIISQDKAINSVYCALISYPKDEETTSVLIEYLETNHHLLAIMKTFHFYASLVDDILEVRAGLYLTDPI